MTWLCNFVIRDSVWEYKLYAFMPCHQPVVSYLVSLVSTALKEVKEKKKFFEIYI